MTAPHDSLRIVVRGTPGPQGSKTRLAHGAMVESSAKVKPWRQDVKAAAEQERLRLGALAHSDHDPDGIAGTWVVPPLDEPLVASMVFTLRKPASAPKRRRTWPAVTPDLSKLVRSTEDALTDAGVWTDDARVVEYVRLAKVYPGEDPDALEVPGAVIRVRTVASMLERLPSWAGSPWHLALVSMEAGR